MVARYIINGSCDIKIVQNCCRNLAVRGIRDTFGYISSSMFNRNNIVQCGINEIKEKLNWSMLTYKMITACFPFTLFG